MAVFNLIENEYLNYYRDGELVFTIGFSDNIPKEHQREMARQFLYLINRGQRRCKDCKFYEAKKFTPTVGECMMIWEYAEHYDDFLRYLQGHGNVKSKLAVPRSKYEEAAFEVSEDFGCVEWKLKPVTLSLSSTLPVNTEPHQ